MAPAPNTSKARRIAYSIIAALLLGGPAVGFFAFASSERLESLHCLKFVPGDPRMTGIALGCVALVGGFLLVYAALGRLEGVLERLSSQRSHAFGLELTAKSIALTALVLFACWLPVMVLLYPCSTTGYDTINQLYQFFTDAPTYYTATHAVVDAKFIDHHPVFDTLVFGAFTALGRMVGNEGAGMFAYVVLQGLLTAGALATALCYLDRLRTPYVVRVVMLVVCCVSPLVSVSVATMQKDSLFVPFFLLFTVGYLEAFRSKGEVLRNPKFLVALIVLACLSALTKKLGVYLCAASALVMLLALKGTRIQALVLMVVPPLICLLIVPALVFPALNVARGGSQEMLGMFYQQAVAVLKDHPDSVTEQERASMDKVIEVDKAVAHFDPVRTDGVKRHQRADMTVQDFIGFLPTWVSLGLKQPATYLSAHAACGARLVVPSERYGLSVKISAVGIESFKKRATGLGQDFDITATNPEPLQEVVTSLKTFYEDVLCTWPPLSLFFTIGFYGSWVAIVSFMLVLYRDKRATLALAPIVLSSLALLVCPASLARYALPLVFLVVPAVGWVSFAFRPKSRPGL